MCRGAELRRHRQHDTAVESLRAQATRGLAHCLSFRTFDVFAQQLYRVYIWLRPTAFLNSHWHSTHPMVSSHTPNGGSPLHAPNGVTGLAQWRSPTSCAQYTQWCHLIRPMAISGVPLSHAPNGVMRRPMASLHSPNGGLVGGLWRAQWRRCILGRVILRRVVLSNEGPAFYMRGMLAQSPHRLMMGEETRTQRERSGDRYAHATALGSGPGGGSSEPLRVGESHECQWRAVPAPSPFGLAACLNPRTHLGV